MPFKKGISGNISGRKKGSVNKNKLLLRNRINDFLELNFDIIIDDINKMDPKDRIRSYIELLNYTLPKLKAVETTTPEETPEQFKPIIITVNHEE